MLLQTLLLASTASATCLHGLSKFAKRAGEGEEGAVEVGKFGYTGLVGPFNWAALAPENEACKTGKQQSPINIEDGVIALATEKPVLDIPEQAVEFENLGTTIEVIANGTTKFAGSDFRLKQFHFHTPSEHRINEEYFPLEMHMVHEGVTDANSIAVISVLFQLSTGEPNPVVKGLQPHLQAIREPGTKTEIEGLPLESLVEHVQNVELFQYGGSLTTPPCAEGLTFLVTKEPLQIDVDTFNEMKSIVKFNSRYTQNVLGEENLIAVGNVAGTADQFSVEQPEAGEPIATNATANATATIAGQPTKGHTITVSEIQGTPTYVVGVVQKKAH
ncbi:carbonic anhydrase [Zopfia rhizophila CBS 207.26]|uniref:Carbonic anhydrase n=1 Tax=Zopfia rhizophila CBS 207.26 TaxID=1314779 RepID=A0A6A6ENG2_9PEZI|nr:carbonic anhydrase [Zopfia rhizophila CBS 207.26]